MMQIVCLSSNCGKVLPFLIYSCQNIFDGHTFSCKFKNEVPVLKPTVKWTSYMPSGVTTTKLSESNDDRYVWISHTCVFDYRNTVQALSNMEVVASG